MGFSISAKASEAERHLADVTCVLYHQNKVFTGGDDGKVKVWTPDLKLIKEINAHPVNVYSIAAGEDTLYSCSNDGTLKAWALDSYELKKTLVDNPQNEIMRLFYTEGRLYSGDDKGNVLVFENDEQAGKYEVVEEVWDILVQGSFLLTVRNMDVSIIDMKPGFKQYSFLHSLSGRSPLRKAGGYFCFLEREARNINVCELSKESKFQPVGLIKGHEMIVNALGSVDTPEPTLFSGGYDKNVKRWDVKTQKHTGTAELETVVNTVAAFDINSVYVGGAIGYLAKIIFQ